MKRLAMLRLLAIIISGVTFLMIPSFVTAIIMEETPMIWAFLVSIITGIIIALPTFIFKPKAPLSFRTRDGFLLVFLTWIFASLAGSIPYLLSPLNIHFSNAIFESSCSFATS